MENLEFKKHRTIEGYKKALEEKTKDLNTRMEYETDPEKLKELREEFKQLRAELDQLEKTTEI